jgi:hypothetical protein
MTLARPFRAVLLALAVLPFGLAASRAEEARPLGTGERVVSDPYTGIAIYGFDPVAYFTDGKARGGSSQFEARWRGAVWRFANGANRDAFAADPAVYAPAFGGFDAESITRGVAVASDPTVFAVLSGRLYLFRSPEAKGRFVAEKLGSAANAAWERMEPSLLH